jgi:hypothetical protein
MTWQLQKHGFQEEKLLNVGMDLKLWRRGEKK